ncbi:MAG: hypothetical protein ACRC6U_03665 [Fusobacteriaceae bacterium]
MKKKLLKIFLFLFLSLFIFKFSEFVLTRYNIRIKRWESFYKIPKNELDLVFLGSSHSYTTYNPEVFDNTLKTNSFNMGSNSQALDQLYFNLCEILNYQRPKYVFIELFSLSGNSKYNAGNWFIYDNLDGQKISINKIKTVINYRKKSDYLNSITPFFRNHNNWKKPDVLSANLKRILDKNNKKELIKFSGFEKINSEMNDETVKKYASETPNKFKNFKVSDYNENYLKKINQLSNKYKFKIIYVYSPMYRDYINPFYAQKHNVLKEKALKYGDDFLDFNIIGKEIGLTKSSFENAYNRYQHTSYKGSKQISEYLVEYIKKNNLLNISREKSEFWQTRNNDTKYYYDNNILIEKQIAENQILIPEIKIEKIFYVKEKNVIEIKFSKDTSLDLLKDYNLKIHARPTNENDKTKLKNGYQNWDIPGNQVVKYQGQNYFLTKKVDPLIKNYILNIALYKVIKNENGKVNYPNYGEQLYLPFNLSK